LETNMVGRWKKLTPVTLSTEKEGEKKEKVDCGHWLGDHPITIKHRGRKKWGGGSM